MTVKYGVSYVSALHVGFRRSLRPPGCFFASPASIVKELREQGYDGVQMIPVWGLELDEMMIESILLSQGPWNAVRNLWQAARHIKGSMGVRSEIKDWVVSPPPDVCLRLVDEMNQAGIRRVYHDLGQGHLVELHPGLDRGIAEIVKLCLETELRLVLDLRHLRRPYGTFEVEEEGKQELRERLGPSPLWQHGTLEEWREIITTLSPFVDVIHVQPGDDESPDQFVANPLGTDTGLLLLHALQAIEAVAPNREVVLIGEYVPGVKCLVSPRKSQKLSEDYLNAMRFIVKTAA